MIRTQIRSRVRETESIDAVMAGAERLGYKRAQLLERSPNLDDIRFSLSIFCYWPFKTPPPEETEARLVQLRGPLFRAAALGDYGPLEQAVPDSTLTATREQLAELHRQGVDSLLRLS